MCLWNNMKSRSANLLLMPCIVHKVIIKIVAANTEDFVPWYNSSMVSSKKYGLLWLSSSWVLHHFFISSIIKFINTNICQFVRDCECIYGNIFKLFFEWRYWSVGSQHCWMRYQLCHASNYLPYTLEGNLNSYCHSWGKIENPFDFQAKRSNHAYHSFAHNNL